MSNQQVLFEALRKFLHDSKEHSDNDLRRILLSLLTSFLSEIPIRNTKDDIILRLLHMITLYADAEEVTKEVLCEVLSNIYVALKELRDTHNIDESAFLSCFKDQTVSSDT